jgi:hypothetical protein
MQNKGVIYLVFAVPSGQSRSPCRRTQGLLSFLTIEICSTRFPSGVLSCFNVGLRCVTKLICKPSCHVLAQCEFATPILDVENLDRDLIPVQGSPKGRRGPISERTMKFRTSHHRAVPSKEVSFELSGKLLHVSWLAVGFRHVA